MITVNEDEDDEDENEDEPTFHDAFSFESVLIQANTYAEFAEIAGVLLRMTEDDSVPRGLRRQMMERLLHRLEHHDARAAETVFTLVNTESKTARGSKLSTLWATSVLEAGGFNVLVQQLFREGPVHDSGFAYWIYVVLGACHRCFLFRDPANGACLHFAAAVAHLLNTSEMAPQVVMLAARAVSSIVHRDLAHEAAAPLCRRSA